uniref:Uncharacterized protein n=1 Tax=Avena sativa TaxID=4498 RepID=A0ACD5X0M9_AVESA
MAYFPVNPFCFVPDGLTLDDGPADRLVRAHLAVPADASLFHCDTAIDVANWEVPDLMRPEMLEDLVSLLRYDQHVVIRSAHSSPFGIGLLRFENVIVRDAIIDGPGYELDEDTHISFVRHGAALILRTHVLGQERWVLFLGFPLDYRTKSFITTACAGFGRLILWHEPNGNLSRVLARV